MAEILHAAESSFESILKENKIVLVDFWATWCGPCRMLGPVVEELAGEYAGKVKVCKLNVDEAPDTSSKYRITSIPTIIFFKDGEVAGQTVGLQSKSALQEKLNALL